ALRAATARELVTRRELVKVVSALGDHGIRPLLFKGAALGFTHYPSPVLRPRIDVDLLIGRNDVEVAANTFSGLGYEKAVSVTGKMIRSQSTYWRCDHLGFDHVFDLHWKISNSH